MSFAHLFIQVGCGNTLSSGEALAGFVAEAGGGGRKSWRLDTGVDARPRGAAHMLGTGHLPALLPTAEGMSPGVRPGTQLLNPSSSVELTDSGAAEMPPPPQAHILGTWNLSPDALVSASLCTIPDLPLSPHPLHSL